MNKIVFNDSTEIENGLISVNSENQIFISIPGTDISRAASLFSNTNKTQKMICYFSVYKFTYTGFTVLSSISVNSVEDKLNIYMTSNNGSKETEYTVPEEYLPEEMRSKNV